MSARRRRIETWQQTWVAWASATLACVVSACSSTPLTQVSVELDAESGVRSEVTHVRVVVEAGTGDMLVTRFDEVRPITRWPITAALVPLDGRTSRVMRIEAQGLTGASVDTARVVSRVRLVTGFADGRAVRATLRFEDCCRGSSCEGEETCSRCGCVDARMDATTLPDLIGDASTIIRDGATGDGSPRDDAAVDGGGAESDGATTANDGGPLCEPTDWRFEQVAEDVHSYPTVAFDAAHVLHAFYSDGTPKHRRRLMPDLWSSPTTISAGSFSGQFFASGSSDGGVVVCGEGCWLRESNGTFTRLSATSGTTSSVGVHEGRLFVAGIGGTAGSSMAIVDEQTSVGTWSLTPHTLARGTSVSLASFDGAMRAVIVDGSLITEQNADGSGSSAEITTTGSNTFQPALGAFGDELILLHGVARGASTALVVASRGRGGTWSSGATLDSSVTWRAHLARHRSGRAHAAWSAGGSVMRYTTRDATGTWSLPEDVPRAGLTMTLVTDGDELVLGFVDQSTRTFWIASRTVCPE